MRSNKHRAASYTKQNALLLGFNDRKIVVLKGLIQLNSIYAASNKKCLALGSLPRSGNFCNMGLCAADPVAYISFNILRAKP